MLERLVFIDETSLKTNLVKTTGWAPIGQRLVDHAPFGHWHTQTFIAGLAHDGLIAPWVLDGAMNRASFEAYVTCQLAPALRPGQIVRRENSPGDLGRSSWPTTCPRTNPAPRPPCCARKAAT
jgi:DDE superfamily endonuclease